MRLHVLGMALWLGACAGQQQPARDDSLYQALGGKPGISRIVEGMLLNVARDERIVAHFRNVNIAARAVDRQVLRRGRWAVHLHRR